MNNEFDAEADATVPDDVVHVNRTLDLFDGPMSRENSPGYATTTRLQDGEDEVLR